MKSIATILNALIILLSGIRSAEASVERLNRCSALFDPSISSQTYVANYRYDSLNKFRSEYPSEKLGYLIQGKLGQSTSIVYLALDPVSRASVVIKQSTKSLAISISMLWRELVVTEYLLGVEELVPKIFRAEINDDGKTIIVKEYFEGMTGNELEMARQYRGSELPKELSEDAWASLDAERDRLKELFANGRAGHPSFKDWYTSNQLRLIAKYRLLWAKIEKLSDQDTLLKRNLERDIFSQDFGRTNLLFSVQLGKWIAFDP